MKYKITAGDFFDVGRPPHGGRGLKLHGVVKLFGGGGVAPRTGGVD